MIKIMKQIDHEIYKIIIVKSYSLIQKFEDRTIYFHTLSFINVIIKFIRFNLEIEIYLVLYYNF